MLDPRIVITVFCLYMGFLFFVAQRVEKRSMAGENPTGHPLFYTLSLAVYCTAWTYYGSVGMAASSGLLFLPIYLGPTVSIFLWWIVLRKLVRLKSRYRITSIADFISARYHKSEPLAILVTVMALLGTMPYIALQLKAVTNTFMLITAIPAAGSPAESFLTQWVSRHMGLVVTLFMIFFTIVLGVRRLDPTERHEGMVAALAVECVVKLAAFLAVGIFVTYFMYDGFNDIFEKLMTAPASYGLQQSFLGQDGASYLKWLTYFVLAMAAILFLPRQFHVAVVENGDERHIKTAMWMFPLYLFLINVFVVPIAVAGLLNGYSVSAADNFVLLLPLDHGKAWLSLLVFIGGFSAAAGMIMISSVTLATMLTNHILLPLVGCVRCLEFLKRHLLRCRWAAVALVIFTGYWFEYSIGESYMLVNIGLMAFASSLQFAPLILGGIFWKRGNEVGATWGLSAGFAVWFYTLLLPSFVKSGWISSVILTQGPWGIELLRPEELLGLSLGDPLSHTVFWSLLLNVFLYIFGSLCCGRPDVEESTAQEFACVPETECPFCNAQDREAFIDLSDKETDILRLFLQYFPEKDALSLLTRCKERVGIGGQTRISIVDLVNLQSEVEKSLAGYIGAASAYKAMSRALVLDERESHDLSGVYAEIIRDLRITPGELKEKVDYYKERELLLQLQAQELEVKVDELEKEINERQRAQKALAESERRFRSLVETMNEGLEIEDGNGVITYVNDRLCQIWESSREDIIGKRLRDFLDADQCEVVEEKLRRRVKGEVVSCEADWIGRGGSKISTLVSAVPHLNSEKAYQGSFTVITDITSMKVQERERANIISMFAHDMRSSLVGIHGLGMRLLNKYNQMDDIKRGEYLRIVNQEAGKLETLVDDFLEFSRLETGRLKLNFSATSMEKELMELQDAYLGKTAQADIRMELLIEEALPTIYADGNRLRRVFTNLLDNAIKFSKPKSIITIEAKEVPDGLVVKIKDQGMGIHSQELPFIFDLFHRGKGVGKKEGYGIGLATVKAIVEGHGGRVSVTSELGKGSTFIIFLPHVAKPKDTAGQ